MLSSEKLYQSQMLGMKGIMDLIVEGEIENKRFPITMELKTGKNQRQKDIIQVFFPLIYSGNDLLSTSMRSSKQKQLLRNPCLFKILQNIPYKANQKGYNRSNDDEK